MSDFAQVTNPTDSIRGILGQYPLGTGLFRELLQNSDDAGASEQVFVLDCRTHEPGTGFVSGPALIAQNNALVKESDWEGLQRIHNSSKTRDANTTGKYGIGFRATFHITDTPEILSGPYLAMFDPLRQVLDTTGAKRVFVGQRPLRLHLATFSSVLTSKKPYRQPYEDATAIRLPLRCVESIFGPVVTTEDMFALLHTFVRDEMSTVMLFLRNISSIIVRVVAATGEKSTIATSWSKRSEPVHMHGVTVREVSIDRLYRGEDTHSRSLLVTRADDTLSFARDIASRLGNDSTENSIRVESLLQDEKLVPEVGIAYPLDSGTDTLGRLFTFLPLPITTGLPFHINAHFALTSDRQALLNPDESGTAHSSHRLQVEWNKLLFSRAIPRAWSALLRVCASGGIDIVALWPRSAPLDQAHGQVSYWNRTPVHLAELLWRESVPVWPLVRGSRVALLQDVLVATDLDEPLGVALADVGLMICRLPSHIVTTLHLANVPVTGLTPERVHEQLRKHPRRLYELPLTESGLSARRLLLDFLLTSRPFSNIIGLPLIPLESDPDVHFILERSSKEESSADDSSKDHSLNEDSSQKDSSQKDSSQKELSKKELSKKDSTKEAASASIVDGYVFDVYQSALFGPLKSIKYALSSNLPPSFSQALLNNYNLRRPNAAQVADLAMKTLDHFLDSGNEDEALLWAIQLWDWVSSLSNSKRAAYTKALGGLPVLPTSNGGWIRVSFTGVYQITDETRNPELQSLLQRGGLCFLHPGIPAALLKEQGLIRSIRDASSLLTDGAFERATMAATSESQAQALLDLLADILATSPPSEQLRSPLRRLPIFPVIAAGELATSTKQQMIPKEATVFVVPDDLSLPLPVVPNVYFIPATLPHIIARTIGAQDAPLTLLDVLRLALDNFSGQESTFQAAVVRRMAKDRESIPRNLISQLEQVRFVPVAGGNSTARPCDVINPRSSLHPLFPADSEHIPQRSTRDQRHVIKNLSKLGLLMTDLTPTIANECIERISMDPANPDHLSCATTLLQLLDTANLDMRLLKLDDVQTWIPCEDAVLRTRVACRDAFDDEHHHPRLFDRVLALASVCVRSPALREVLKWDQPISIAVLKRQFKLCVDDDGVSAITMWYLIGELAGRRLEISALDMEELRAAAKDKKWVPVDDQLHRADHVVSDLPVALLPFHAMQTHSMSRRSFLLEMGCLVRPGTQSILDALLSLQDDTGVGVEADVERAVSLLKAICLEPLDEAQLSQIVVLADDCCLHPRERVYYDDMPAQAGSLKLPNNTYRTHETVDAELARRLRLKPLSKLYIREQYDEEDMGEPLSSRVSNVLVQYQREQMPTEFLANALDAGATSVSFTIDMADFSVAITDLLQPALKEFQSGGSLVVYNNSRFTKDDWSGIKRVGQGSKRGVAGTIGRFGLGALAAYHISEVTMIVSGEFFLILDPSRRYLGDGRASRQIRLEDMHTFYRDQLRPFYGLHGFEEGDVYYEGTLFRLPLRTLSQAAKSELCKVSFSTTDAQLLLDRYSDSGKLAALFVPALVSLRVSRRVPGHSTVDIKALNTTPLWSLEVARSDRAGDTLSPPSIQAACVRLRLSLGVSDVTEVWETYSQSLHLSAADQRLADRYRLSNTISVGVALRSDTRETGTQSRLFSYLPLPISTSLPFHVHASFIMAEDRRAIRLDETSLEDSESSFNRRLLSTYAPALYLEALYRFPEDRTLLDESLLPRRHGVPDAPSRLVADGLYSLFATDCRLTCQSVNGHRIAPSSAIFADQSVPEGVRCILELLAPPNLVLGPTALRHTTIPRVMPGFVRDCLIASQPAFQDLYESAQITVGMVDSLIQYLLDDDPSGGLLFDLHILPLADETLTTFDQESSPVFALSTSSRPVLVGNDAPWHEVFPANSFLHPDVSDSLQDSLLSASVQIKLFDDHAIAQLVSSRLPALPKCTLSVEDARWVTLFWALYPSIHPSDSIDDSLLDLPLVPVRGKEWNSISLTGCNSVDVFFKSTTTPLIPLESLHTMGASIIDKPSLPHMLRQHEVIQASSFSLPSVLRFLELGAHERFDLLREPLSTDFRSWLKTQLCRLTSLSQQDLAIARSLPLVQVRRTSTFAAPNDIIMIPKFVRIEHVLPLTDDTYQLADFDGDVHRVFQSDTVGIWDLSKAIAARQDVGQVATADALAGLRGYLNSVLDIPQVSAHDLSPIRIPNVHGVYVAAEELFARTVPLFVDIFNVEGRRPDAFVHHELSGLEGRMQKLAVKTEIDMEAFGECVRTVHDATDPARIDSAHLLYAFYREHLPRIGRVNWMFLEDRCFIPRHLERRDKRPEFNAYAMNLPLVVAPSQIVLSKYERIAWSQRARVADPPTMRLLAEQPELGIPTPGDVVAHLHVLKRIGQDYPYDPAVMTDAQASYAYLEETLDDLPQEVMQTLRAADVFLNTDGRDTVWQWCSPSSLILNAPDDGEDYKRVRGSLRSYTKLLSHLGTISIVEADTPSIPLAGVEDTLKMMRASFDEKRRAQVAIDVIFVDADEPPGRHPAHRIFLAACAVHFEAAFFQSDMREAASVQTPIEMPLQCSGDAIERCLDYFYTGTYEKVKTEDLHVLFDMLALADYWDVVDFRATVELDLATHLSPNVYELVRDNAKQYHADNLIRICAQWEERNRVALRRVGSGRIEGHAD